MPAIVSPRAGRAHRYAVLVVGLLAIATGVACTIQAGFGVAPYDVLSTGIRDRFGVPIGVAAVVLPAVFIALSAALGRRPGGGSLLAVVVVGPVLGTVLAALPDTDALLPRSGLFAVGFVVITVGITLTIVPEIGSGPAELLMLALHDRGHPLAGARTAIEVVSVAVGWAMGGEVGVGTVVFALLIGPVLRRALELAGYDHHRAVAASDAAAPGA